MRRGGAFCFAYAPNGQFTAAPPIIVMKSRRLIAAPRAWNKASYQSKRALWKGPVNVRFGSKADIRTAKRHVRFTPESGHVRCTRDVRFVPIADILISLDHFIGALLHA